MEQYEVIGALSALAQPTRLTAFRLIVRHGPDGLPAGEIARQLEVPQNTMSTHLAQLARSGLVLAERQGRTVAYRADMERMRGVIEYLVNDCCGGRPELCDPLINDITTHCSPVEKRAMR